MVNLPATFSHATSVPLITEQELAIPMYMDMSYLDAIAGGMDQLPYEPENMTTPLQAYRNGLIPGDLITFPQRVFRNSTSEEATTT